MENLIIVGKTNSGKTTLAKSILNEFVISNHAADVIIVKDPKFDWENGISLFNATDILIKQIRNNTHKATLLIVDEFRFHFPSTKIDSFELTELKEIIKKGPSFGISTILISQELENFHSEIRNNYKVRELK